MGWLKHKKRKKIVNRVKTGFRFIFNNLVKAWEVYEFTRNAPGAVLRALVDEHGKAVDETEEVRAKISRDYQDAERYVKEGVSHAYDFVGDLKEAFKDGK